MFKRIALTAERNKVLNLEGQQTRITDPFESARLALQQRGVVVFAESVKVPGSRLYIVGQHRMTVEQVIAHAERFALRTPKEK